MSSKLTLKPDIVLKWILLLASAGFLAHGVGYIFDERAPDTVQLEGSTKWCLSAEYGSIKEYQGDETRSGTSFIDIGRHLTWQESAYTA